MFCRGRFHANEKGKKGEDSTKANYPLLLADSEGEKSGEVVWRPYPLQSAWGCGREKKEEEREVQEYSCSLYRDQVEHEEGRRGGYDRGIDSNALCSSSCLKACEKKRKEKESNESSKTLTYKMKEKKGQG